MTKLKNETELKSFLMPKLKTTVDYIVQKIWNENREVVRQIIYDVYQPKKYERTNQFRQAWGTDVKVMNTVVEGEFKYDPRLLEVNPSMGQHSSIVDNTYGDPMTTYLADIIYQGLAGDFTGQYRYAKNNPKFAGEAWTKKRDAWKQLQDSLGRSLLKKWIKEGFEYAGLSVKSHKKTWGKIEW